MTAAQALRRLRRRLRHTRGARWLLHEYAMLPSRWWLVTCVFTVSAVLVAIGVVGDRRPSASRVDPAVVRVITEALGRVSTTPVRVKRVGYVRSAFGTAWTDSTDAAWGRNGCDTRDDILRRDLRDITTAATDDCPTAVATGEFTSPYTGDWISFRRGAGTGTAVQIDHIVPLAYAWDMGAGDWSEATRTRFANDPANLVAVDGRSNQDKSDQQPALWMPARRGFHCQYAVQFVLMVDTYGLRLDLPTTRTLRQALGRC
nr:HNH endonuclease family protein [Williamsia sterculiae]